MANKWKQKRAGRMVESILAVEADEQPKADSVSDIKFATNAQKNWWFGLSRNGKLLLVGMMLFVAAGVLGAGFKYLEDDAKRQQSDAKILAADLKNQSWLNRINPFISAPLPTSTPQLAREYLYAGGRLLTVEDANANAAPSADFAVWRPSVGEWLVLNGQTSQMTGAQWGSPGDVVVQGDYDGDGKTDFSVFRPSSNDWYIIRSSDNSYLGFNFGTSGDIPVAADYDGDGLTDAAVFRPTGGVWLVRRSSDGIVTGVQFGMATDKFAPADFDGDGKADYMTFRPSTQYWYLWQSATNTYIAVQFGLSTDIPVVGDYDGDGKSDIAVRRGNDWIIRNNSNGQEQPPITWEQAGDIAVPNDYDGDGKMDIATWRDANGTWYIRNSSTGQLRQQTWGVSGDIPVPAFYRR